ncbi:MAG: 50S ribosomal protein L11 [Thermoplasmata archaeon]
MAIEVSILVEGGKAAAGATLGSALGPLGVNVGQVVTKINEQTKEFAGMRVPVVIRVDPNTREFTLVVGRPPVAALLLKEAKKEKGSGKPKTEVIGDVSMEAVKRIAESKGDDLHGRSIEEKMNQVIGSCTSLGITVDGEDPRAVLQARVAARGAR